MCLPAGAATWRDDFEGGDLNRWLKFDLGDFIPSPKWDAINGELVATVEGQRVPNDGGVVVLTAAGWVLPSQALMELTEQDDLTVEVKLKGELMKLKGEAEGVNSIGMVIAQKDDGFLYKVTWSPKLGVIEVRFLGPKFRLMDSGIGVNPVPIQGEMGKWYKMGLKIRQRPFQVKVYWDGVLIKEFGAPFILRAEDDFIFPIGLRTKDDVFPVGAVGLWVEGYAFRAYFDDFFIAWGNDSAKSIAVHPKSNLATTWGKIKASSRMQVIIGE
jgi:hypothetical protein